MSLVTREMAAQNGFNHTANSTSPNGDDRMQIAQRNPSHSNGNDSSRNYNPHPSSFSSPKQSTASDKGNNGLADFFSSEVFQIVLHNPTTAHRLLKFSQARMCGENMEFLEKVRRVALPGFRGILLTLRLSTDRSLQCTSGRVDNCHDRHTSRLYRHRGA